MDFSKLFLLATAAKALRPSEDVEEESFADPSVLDPRSGAAAEKSENRTQNDPATVPEPPQAQVVKAAPPPPPNRTSAEQRRREALEESLTEYLPISHVRAVERMNEKELKASKNLLMCFLSGRAPPDDDDERTAGSDDEPITKRPMANEDRSSKCINDFQHDMTNLSAAYHYKYDPSLPLPTSLIDRRIHLPQEKTHKRVKKSKDEKKKKQKTIANKDEDVVLTKITENPLLSPFPWTIKQTESNDTEGDDCISEPAAHNSGVPTVVDVNPSILTENQDCALDESVHSS